VRGKKAEVCCFIVDSFDIPKISHIHCHSSKGLNSVITPLKCRIITSIIHRIVERVDLHISRHIMKLIESFQHLIIEFLIRTISLFLETKWSSRIPSNSVNWKKILSKLKLHISYIMTESKLLATKAIFFMIKRKVPPEHCLEGIKRVI